MTTPYTSLSLAEVQAGLAALAVETQSVFGRLDEQQLNWRPDAKSWSVAQCFDHLISANREMLQAIDAALDTSRPRTLWQQMPVLPRVFGSMLIKSQMPEATRKFTAPQKATPSSSAIDGRIIERFAAQQHEAAARMRALDEQDAARTVMVSPFVAFITYTVLDGCRLMMTHEHRHFEQARRVTRQPGFPLATADTFHAET